MSKAENARITFGDQSRSVEVAEEYTEAEYHVGC